MFECSSSTGFFFVNSSTCLNTTLCYFNFVMFKLVDDHNPDIFKELTRFCIFTGSLPKFYQGHENTTVIFVEMTGYTQNATGLMATMQEQQQLTGNIPLRIRVTQPVRVKLGKLKLMEIRFLVRCGVSVDSLAANNVIRVRSSNCKFRFRL